MNNNIFFSIIIINIWMVCVLKYLCKLFKLLKILLFSQDLRFEIFK